MTLPASPNAISLSQVNTELGLTATATISMNDAAVRTLFGKASGAISMSDGHGKANQFALTISTNQTNANLRTLAINAGWNQVSNLIVTISSGVIVSSNNTGIAALTVAGAFPNGVTLVNNGIIVGKGGNGAYFSQGSGGGLIQAQAGGVGLAVSSAISIQNAGTIGGGGGGGGMNSDTGSPYGNIGGNGGAGFGSDGWNWHWGNRGLYWQYAGNGDVNGTASATAVTVQGGNIWTNNYPFRSSQSGYAAVPLTGAGGALGAAGGDSQTAWGSDKNGWYAVAQSVTPGRAGGAAISGNSNITWVATGTRLGAIT